MDNPKLIQVPFAEQSTARNNIPVSRTVDLSAENATYQEGFPNVVMTPVFTGTFTTGNAKTATVVNGLIVGVV